MPPFRTLPPSSTAMPDEFPSLPPEVGKTERLVAATNSAHPQPRWLCPARVNKAPARPGVGIYRPCARLIVMGLGPHGALA
jgi:hypothetical protein